MITIHKRIARGLLAIFLLTGSVRAEEIVLAPLTPADYGSGASVREDFYIPGEEAKQLFVGHPNSITRGDRALVRFNLEPLLLKAALISKAELVVYFEKMLSQDPDESRHLVIERLLDPIETLSGATVSSRNAEVIAEYDVKRDELINPAATADRPVGPRPEPARFDVTKIIRSELEAGTTSLTIRFSDSRAEAEPNDTGGPIGIVLPIEAETIPQLLIEVTNP